MGEISFKGFILFLTSSEFNFPLCIFIAIAILYLVRFTLELFDVIFDEIESKFKDKN